MFMILFMSFLVLFLSLLSLVTNNMIVWWSIFLLMTVIFIFLNKNMKSYTSLINYFIIQESLGLMFLLMNFGLIQFFIVLMKIGVAPLHFWIFSVINNVFNYNLMWFLTFQKLPFLMILLQVFLLSSIMLLILGFFICYLQMFLTKNYKNLLVLSSTESFNWIILGLLFSFINSFFLFLYYFFIMILLINSFSKMNFNNLSWETVLVFLNIPFSVTFFVKIFSLSEIFNFSQFYLLVILFMMFFSALSFSYWLINISLKYMKDVSVSSKMYLFLIYPLMIICLI